MVILFAVALLFAILTGEGVVYQLTYFLALVIIGSYVYARLRLRHLDMRMENKFYIGPVGDTLTGYVHLRNDSRLGTGWVEIIRMSDMPGGVLGVATAVPAGEQKQGDNFWQFLNSYYRPGSCLLKYRRAGCRHGKF